MRPTPRPFPFAGLPRRSLREVALRRSLLRALVPPRAETARWCPAAEDGWAEVVGGPIAVRAGALRLRAVGGADTGTREASFGVLLESPQCGAVGLGIDAPWLLRVASRIQGVPRGRLEAHVDGEAGGVLLALVATVLARLVAPEPPPVIVALSERDRDVIPRITDTDALLEWDVAVVLGGDATRVRVWFAAERVRLLPPLPVSLEHLDPRIEVPVLALAARERLPAADVVALRTGDVLAWDAGDRPESAHWLVVGAHTVSITSSASGCRASGPAGRSFAVAPSRDMDAPTDPSARNPTDAERVFSSDSLGDVPVDVDVVIASQTLALGEIAAWRVGEVLTMPVPVGAEVVVRAGGRPVARGVLCDVEGAVGVEITALLR